MDNLCRCSLELSNFSEFPDVKGRKSGFCCDSRDHESFRALDKKVCQKLWFVYFFTFCNKFEEILSSQMAQTQPTILSKSLDASACFQRNDATCCDLRHTD